MKDDLERQMNDDDSMDFKELNRSSKDELEREVNNDNSTPFLRGRRIRPSSNNILPILMGILIVLVFAGGLFYFVTRHSTEGDATMQSKMPDFEQRITDLERQITELQGKWGTVGPDSGLLQRVDALAKKVESLEKQKQPTDESKAKLSPPSKQAVLTEKKYHTVQKGETLSGISKKYGISVEELRKRNNLSADQPIRTGRKLLVSTGR